MNLPTCPLLRRTRSTTARKNARDGRWGMTTHIKTLLVCTRCRYVLTFYDHNSIFDFD